MSDIIREPDELWTSYLIRKEEAKVARGLGKEKEWREWRKAIDGRFK